jgi:hypothetical protein
MKKIFLSMLAAFILFPAVSFARDYHPRYDRNRYDHVYRGRPWYSYERPGYWNRYRVPPRYRSYDHYRRPGYDSRRYDRRYDWRR